LEIGEVVYQADVHDLASLDVSELISAAARESYNAQNQRWRDQTERIYVLREPVTVDGRSGLVLHGGKIIAESRIDESTFPSPGVRFFPNTQAERIDTAYLLDVDAGDNYFHFFCDTLLSYLLFRMKVTAPMPLLIHERVISKPYVKQIIEGSTLKDEQ